MNKMLNVIQDRNSSLEVFCSEEKTSAAAYLIAYVKNLKMQKIFQTA